MALVRASTFLVVLSASLLSGVGCAARQVGGNAQTPSRNVGQPVVQQHQAPGSEANTQPEQITSSEELVLEEVPGELPPPAFEAKPHPHAELSDKDLEALVLRNEAELGAASLGKTNAGALFGAEQMQPSKLWKIVNSRETYGTTETIAYLSHAIERVNETFPGTPVINVGDISKPKGGHFTPHLSHQSGRDVDLGFYYKDGSAWYAHGTAKNLDLPRTWALIKYTIVDTDVEIIFVDRSIQKLLRSYAAETGEDEQWLDAVFGGPSSNLRPMLLHEKGHKSHLHIRYYNPIAQETGRRVYRALLKHKKIKPPTYYLKYKVRRGDSLIRIARKHKTSVAILRKVNRLRGNRIYANRVYKIPKRGGVVQPRKLVLPARRVPQPKTEVVAGAAVAATQGPAATAARAAL